jgi:hypothetical protein
MRENRKAFALGLRWMPWTVIDTIDYIGNTEGTKAYTSRYDDVTKTRSFLSI